MSNGIPEDNLKRYIENNIGYKFEYASNLDKRHFQISSIEDGKNYGYAFLIKNGFDISEIIDYCNKFNNSTKYNDIRIAYYFEVPRDDPYNSCYRYTWHLSKKSYNNLVNRYLIVAKTEEQIALWNKSMH